MARGGGATYTLEIFFFFFSPHEKLIKFGSASIRTEETISFRKTSAQGGEGAWNFFKTSIMRYEYNVTETYFSRF